ncbi:MAG: vanadium-dependent haloperoxidase, partial [Pseudomonadota bacterium]
RVDAGGGDDVVSLESANRVDLGRGDDTLEATGHVRRVDAGGGDDTVTVARADRIDLGRGDDVLTVSAQVRRVDAGGGDDTVSVHDADRVLLGRGDDTLTVTGDLGVAHGGAGHDSVTFAARQISDFDIEATLSRVILTDRFTGEEIKLTGFEEVAFQGGVSLSNRELADAYAPDAAPFITIGDGTQAITVNNPDPTVSVVWDRVVQQAVIETSVPVGPTIAARAYAMMHTAMYDAWASFDETAVRVSRDGADQDNAALEQTGGSEAQKVKAMSFAAHTVLMSLFPDLEPLFDAVLSERYGFTAGDGSVEAAIGVDAAEDLLADRLTDGANQLTGYSSDGSRYVGANGDPDSAGRNIENWTPEFRQVDDPSTGVQGFLTPHWGNVESFALEERLEGGEVVVDYNLPPAPEGFFAAAYAGSSVSLDDRSVTLTADFTLSTGEVIAAGVATDLFSLSIEERAELIGPVINAGFIRQAEEVIAYSGTLTDTGKLVAEFYEDGGGTAFPPGTWMAYAQFVSARDAHDVDTDAQLFLAMGNAVMDAGVATWEAKIEYDYARPIRAIRDLGELGLIGEPKDADGQLQLDEAGRPIYFIEAFAGFEDADDPSLGLGVQVIPATEFVTFQRPGDSSPPFAEYTSGHSAFSRAGAEVLRAFTGSDEFGAEVIFEAGSSQFETGVPEERVTLQLATFVGSDGFNGAQDLTPDALSTFLAQATASPEAWNALGMSAADQAGLSRLFGGIHFQDGDVNGRELGAAVGQQAFDLAQAFINGTVEDEDRPFNDPEMDALLV